MKTWKKILIIASLLSIAVSCRSEPAPEKIKIEKIVFKESVKNIYIGDTAKIDVNVEPKDVGNNSKIEYKTIDEDIIDIKEDSSNSAVLFEGLKSGSTILTAKADGIVDYCTINVLGGSEGVIPHIIVPYHVMECRVDEKRSIVASLAGGTPLDDSGFLWSYTGQRVINLETTGNVGVFDTLRIGESVITISHPKAQFSVNVLVYVTGNDEIPIYVTTDNNVINLKATDSNYQFMVELRGGVSDDYHNFIFELLDGSDIIDLVANNNIGTINPKARGIARIGVSHPKAAYRLEIVVIVSEEIEYCYIDIADTMIIMEEGLNKIIRAEMIGNVPVDYIEKYSFENEDDDVISVQRSLDQFFITGIKRGQSVIKIQNEYADFEREVLVIVNGLGDVIDREVYISTSQNVITTEVGGDDVILTMTLVGGNEADRNNFVWTVDDGSIIEVESAHGRVEYRNRAVVSGSGEKFEAQAIIKAKKVGTAKITLENPKAKNSFSVIVKVYKKNVFGVIPVVINGPSIYKVRIGEKLPVYLSVITGNERNLTNIVWSSEDSAIVSVSEARLTGMLEGKKAGITTIRVSGDNIKHDYTATVIVGNDDYLSSIPFMYVNNPFMSVIKGETVSFRIMCVNTTKEEIANISVVNNNGDIMEVFSYRDSVTVTGLELGEGEIVISGNGLNTIRINVMVEDYNINPDMPYYLRSEKYIYGLVKNRNFELTVNLVGGNAVNEQGIVWKIEDSNVAMISGNGKRCLIEGKNSGQTVITVNHPKSNNSLEIVIYVVENDNDINGKVIIYVKEKNMLLAVGAARYISIITNANDEQKKGFQWDISNTNVTDVSISSDRIKAYVQASSIGNSTILVRHNNQMLPVVIYISVISKANDRAYINVPSIVETAVGETISINAVTNNIYNKQEITWEVKEGSPAGIVSLYGNGDSCMVTAVSAGRVVIRVEYKIEGFIKDIIVQVYGSVAEMASRYIYAGEQSRYVINKGDIINVHLVFGMKGYPEHNVQNIRWNTEDTSVIEVVGNGNKANVRGVDEGIGIITVRDLYDNDIEIEVVVREGNGKTGKYWFSVKAQDRIKGILAGGYADIEIKVYDGSNNEIFNLDGIDYRIENDSIISITPNENSIRVTAAAGMEGQSYIYITHDSAEEARILIYTALTEYGLENAYPILINKTNYLIKKGESVTVTVETKDEDNAKLRNISYDLEKNNGVISISERNKKEIVVNANNNGSDVILVRYNAEVVQRIYVSVTDGNYGSNSSYMVTENIIGLLLNTQHTTTVDTNVNGYLYWKKQDDGIIGVTSNSAKSAVITGEIPGKTLLTVSAGGIERNIVVFVCATEEELRQYKAINIEQRQYKIRKNENVTITIHSYQGKVEGQTNYSDYYNYSNPYGNVIEVNAAENNKLSIKGINEGIAAVRVHNNYYNEEIIVYIEVSDKDEGGTGIVDKKYYLTSEQTLYILDMEDQNIMLSVRVIGENFYGNSKWTWYIPKECDGDVISFNYAGSSAIINPLKEGNTELVAHNDDCVNDLKFTIYVGERFEYDDSLLPYIYLEKNIFEVEKNSGNITIAYTIMNMGNVNNNNVNFIQYHSNIIIGHNASSGTFTVTPKEIGFARFDIMYGSLKRDVYVLVKEETNAGNIYLTTSENYVVMTIGELRTINITLAGYSESNVNNFTWSASPSTGVIQHAGNGTVGQIYGVGLGDAVITIRHPKAEQQALTINIKVVKDKTKESVVYLTTQQNVIETVVGNASSTIYVQKIGGSATGSNNTWNVLPAGIISLADNNGNAAQFTPVKEGITEITVTNSENTQNKLKIVVIVYAAQKNNVYISSDETLLILSPGDVQRKVSVTLVNGDVKDNNKFKWAIDSQQPVDVARGNVITISGSNEECFINAINEGTARIRVSNGSIKPDLIITVYVTQYKELQFSVSRTEIVIGQSEYVGINLPSYEYMGDKVTVTVRKVSNNSDGKGICDVFYTNELVLLNGVSAGAVIVEATVIGKVGSAQLYVNVVDRIDPNVKQVVVSSTPFIINPKTGYFTIEAHISGANVFDADNDNIMWHIFQDGKLDVIPPNHDKTRQINRTDIYGRPIVPSLAVTAVGRQIQVQPKESLGTVTILVAHNYVEEQYWKTITLVIADRNNQFSISVSDIEVNRFRPETVSVNILGGTSRDYDEVVWIAKMPQKWDGTLVEVVRIMGSGKEVMLYPVNDGITRIDAIYNGSVKSIDVTVVSDYIFSFRNGNEYMYPGDVRKLPFTVKPASSRIHWVESSLGGINQQPIVSFAEVTGSSPAGVDGGQVSYLEVRALNEGTTTITGLANNKVSSVNIIVQYDYSFVATSSVSGRPKYNGIVNQNEPINKDGIVYADYTIYPPNTYIMLKNTSLPDGLEVEIESPRIVEADSAERFGGVGVGRIKFTGHRELFEELEFIQYKARSVGDNNHIPTGTSSQKVSVYFRFEHLIVPDPYVIRGKGKFSNVFSDKGRKTLSNGTLSPEGETLLSSSVSQNGEKKYSINLGDGEEHYILFDKNYDTSFMEIESIETSSTVDAGSNGNKISKTLNGTTFEVQLVDLDVNGITRKALRLSGGEDYIEYTRVLFDEELFLSVKSSDYSYNTSTTQARAFSSFSLRAIPMEVRYEKIIGGDWYDVKYLSPDDPDYISGFIVDNIAIQALKNEGIEKMKSNYWQYFDYIANNNFYVGYVSGVRLYETIDNIYYRNDRTFTGSPEQTAKFNDFIENYTETKFQNYNRPVFYYSREYFEQNPQFFNIQLEMGTAVSHFTTDSSTGESSGYITTAFPYDVEREDASFEIDIFEYDPEELEEYVRDYFDNYDNSDAIDINEIDFDSNSNIFSFNLKKEGGNYINWDSGLLREYSSLIDDYNSNYLYSTINHGNEGVRINRSGEVETHYSVFKDKYVNSTARGYSILTVPNGVYFPINSYGLVSETNYINNGFSTSDSYGMLLEYFNYENFYYGKAYRPGNFQREYSDLIPLTGINPNTVGEFSTQVTEQTGTIGNRPIYNRVNVKYYAGTNGEGPNVFTSTGGFNSTSNRIGTRVDTPEDADADGYSRKWYSGFKTYKRVSDSTFLNNIAYALYYNWGNNIEPRLYYAPNYARNRLKWVDTGNKFITPYYIFNFFPLRYKRTVWNIGGNIYSDTNLPEYKNFARISSGKPMPSINKDIINDGTGNDVKLNITVKYKVFNMGSFYNPAELKKSFDLNLEIKFERRPCHMLYEGTQTNDSWINNVYESGVAEIQGEIDSYTSTEGTEHFANKEHIRKFYENPSN